MPTVAFYTLGCKVNQTESFSMMGEFSQAGFTILPPEETADVYIINSCTVTATGDKKSLQALRRFRRRAPGAIIVLCGCFPQAFPERAEAIPEADLIMGSKNRSEVLAGVLDLLAGRKCDKINILPHQEGEPFETIALPALTERTRAFLKIEDGCARNCAYCIIPKARGPVRSKPLADIRWALASFAEQGFSEVVLTGVNLGCYGQDLGLSLSDAVELACEADGLSRIRLGSLEPDLITEKDFIRWAKAGEGKLCPQFHLSLQSGCDHTLRAMNRRYTICDYRETIAALRKHFPNAALTTDVMVGFPGETQRDHEESMAFLREVGFAKTHVFAYSPRPGTPAASMPDQVPGTISSRRAKEMADLAEAARTLFLHTRLGGSYTVLFETRSDDGLYHGYTSCYTPVYTPGEEDISGKIRTVRLTGLYKDGCCGALLDE